MCTNVGASVWSLSGVVADDNEEDRFNAAVAIFAGEER